MTDPNCPFCGSTTKTERVFTTKDALWLTCRACRRVWDVALGNKPANQRPPVGDAFGVPRQRI